MPKPTTASVWTLLLLVGIGSFSCTKETPPPAAATPAPPSTRATLPDGVVDRPYQAKIPTDETIAATWSLQTGALPDGLSLGSASGQISGTPRKVGTFDFTVDRRNATAQTTREDLSIRILAGRVGQTAGGARWAGTYEYRLDQRVPAG